MFVCVAACVCVREREIKTEHKYVPNVCIHHRIITSFVCVGFAQLIYNLEHPTEGHVLKRTTCCS